jgi:hypothetical protein
MTMFDDAGRVVDRDALASVGFSGQGMRVPRARVRDDGAKVETVLHDHDGLPAGEIIRHADGRVSSVVRPRPVTLGRRRDGSR